MSAMNEVRHRRTKVEPVSEYEYPTAPRATPARPKTGGSKGLLSLLVLALLAGLGYVAYSAYGGNLGSRSLTLRQLSAYDGTNPDLPVYISVGGEVFDVSANRRVYGPGGSYAFMAGRDTSRAFITGCFDTHLTHDLRGLDEEQLNKLEQWKDFFGNSQKYKRVGRAVLPKLTSADPIPEMCKDPKAA